MVRAGIYKMRKNSTTVYFCRPLSLVSFKHKESLPASLLFTMLFVCLFACLFGCFIWYSYPQVIENLFLNSPLHPAHLFVSLFVLFCFVWYLYPPKNNFQVPPSPGCSSRSPALPLPPGRPCCLHQLPGWYKLIHSKRSAHYNWRWRRHFCEEALMHSCTQNLIHRCTSN